MNMRREPYRPSVVIYCDGSCLNNGNCGSGGWAAVLHYKDVILATQGYQSDTTNSRMEIIAAVGALKTLKKPCLITIYSDSEYLVKTMNDGWKRKANLDLWEELDKLVSQHIVKFEWVPGHSGIKMNEEVNKLAQRQATFIKEGRIMKLAEKVEEMRNAAAELFQSGIPIKQVLVTQEMPLYLSEDSLKRHGTAVVFYEVLDFEDSSTDAQLIRSGSWKQIDCGNLKTFIDERPILLATANPDGCKDIARGWITEKGELIIRE